MPLKETFQDLPLEEVIGDRFGRYSKYIIQDRALPDARDGLKPVQRRILFAMHMEGNTSEKGFRKSAKTVGNVIGNYHPHGDSSVYEAMVRMSQEWKVRNMLIEMHGNNGSVDGDPAAAMRYTEARLSKVSSELLRDIEKDTVDFISNFDDTAQEPTVLPARFPNLLVNGSTGISAGYATDIPPHHLGEVIDAVIMRMDQPSCTVDDVMKVIKGPDFPTGGIIQGIDGIKKAYETGKGRIIVRGKTEIETIRGGRSQIVITEIPYDVNKANMVKKIDEFRIDRKVEGISEVRDETDRTGLRIVIELRKDADAEGILNYLFKNSDLQVGYNFNMVAIDNRRPKLMSMLELLDAYISHQKEVVTNRTNYELNKARQRHHIVEGLIKALSVLDEVIAIIRASKDKRDAKNNLMAEFQFTEEQAEAIVSLQLYRLTNTDVTALEAEASELMVSIEELTSILDSEKKLVSVIKKELRQVKKKYADERRTVIEDEISELKINVEVLIPNEDVIISVTKDGYIKRTSQRSFFASNIEDLSMKEKDRLLLLTEMNTTETLLLFTNKGYYIYLPVHELPDIKWRDSGHHIGALVSVDRDEEIIKAIPIKDFNEAYYLLFVTKMGMIKKSELPLYKASRYNRSLIAMNLKKDDEVIDVHVTNGEQNIFLATHYGYGLWYSEEEVTPVGVRAQGVKSINLKNPDFVVGAQTFSLSDNPKIVIGTHRGSIKKMNITEFEKGSRSNRGVLMLRELKGNPHRIIGLHICPDNSELIMITENGTNQTINVNELRINDRYSNGSFVIDEGHDGVAVELVRNIHLKE